MQLTTSMKVKKSRLLLMAIACLTLVMTVVWHSPAVAGVPKHYRELEFPPLPTLELPEYSRYELDNGIVIYLMEDRELPLVRGSAIFKTGSRFEPNNKVGLASLTGSLMRAGGTKKHPPQVLNEMLEHKAASVETGVSDTMGNAGFSALSEDLDAVFSLFAEVIREPAFDPQQLELAKNQMRGAIARRNDDPQRIASREFQKLIYGSKSPYARSVEYDHLSQISRSDLVKFHQQYFHPQNMILGIVGDFDSAEMRSLIAEKFGDWKSSREAINPPLPDVNQVNLGGVFMIDQPQLTQSYVQMGHLGGKANNPDYPALMVLNGVMNGFGGRLFNEVRSRQGLAYSVYGVWSPNFDYPGLFISGGQTRSDTTVPLIQAIKSEIKRIRTEPITAEELDYAKESSLNSFVFNFASGDQTLSRLMRYEYFGYPADFIFNYRRQVEETTIEDVQRVAAEYLQPEKLVILVVGNQNSIDPPLNSLNEDVKVTSIDITIPNQT
ncbi:MAG: insulinase family protein [Arthrospira sp. SH-MAG29]|nr:pitrilysin family protein [Arthrospira sp. SH-MAG29]MBS0015413.1 insulinase family protein [Arthrospira sp. SH-MAG29]